jgi:hypothetical protein
MADNIEYLIIEQFRALRNPIEDVRTEMRAEFGEVKRRIDRLGSAFAGFRRDEAGFAEDVARQQASIDRLKERIDRLERRLEIGPPT